MQKVLAHRDDNWKKLQQYILTEKEQIDIRATGGIPVWGEKREYSWFLRDGFFIRSPLTVNGVTISEADRKKYEADFLKQEKTREERRVKAEAARGLGAGAAPAPAAATAADTPVGVDSLIKQSRQPEFISSAYFLRFKFEQGKYALVGHEALDGRDTLRIEYYPAKLFSHEQDTQQRRSQRANTPDKDRNNAKDKDMDAAIETAMNKVSLVTLWIEAKSFQIVKYTFDNVNLDFLPGAWLVHPNNLKATMTMGQPYPEVWLPHGVEITAGVMIAVGQLDARYRLDYTDYKLAETSGRIKRDPGIQHERSGPRR
jgi:hypothetical protein